MNLKRPQSFSIKMWQPSHGSYQYILLKIIYISFLKFLFLLNLIPERIIASIYNKFSYQRGLVHVWNRHRETQVHVLKRLLGQGPWQMLLRMGHQLSPQVNGETGACKSGTLSSAQMWAPQDVDSPAEATQAHWIECLTRVEPPFPGTA